MENAYLVSNRTAYTSDQYDAPSCFLGEDVFCCCLDYKECSHDLVRGQQLTLDEYDKDEG